jgi:hypothetical protein
MYEGISHIFLAALWMKCLQDAPSSSAYLIGDSSTIRSNIHAHGSSLKNAVFWDVILCGSCKNRYFGQTYRLHHQGEKNQQTRNNVISN